VSAPNSNLAGTKALLLDMVAEANDLKRAAGGSITDAVAGWLAPQYLLAAREKLSGMEGARRWDILRSFVEDWAMLRHGDHTAERLQIERDRLKLSERDAEQRWLPKIDAGLDALGKEIKQNPEARAAYEHFRKLVRAGEEPQKEKEFWERLKQPKIRREVFAELTRGLSPETLERIEAELHRP
jgi:hypothetical protein